ncbi:MAG: DHHA1 domain-containing protein, partial [Treponema sp.]|nr:DHHA1 domain-containing protein [Treponema sp.]
AGPFKRTELRNYYSQFLSVQQMLDFCKPETKVIIVDCSGKDRTGEIEEFLDKFPIAIIDHHAAVKHPPSTPLAPVFVNAASPSCTLLVFKLITALGLKLTNEEATLLLFGLCTDTGFFRHLNETNSFVFEAAAEMIRSGASPKNIFNIINGGRSLNSRILLGNILSRVESHFDGKLLISFETLEEFEKYGFEGRDSDSLNQMLLSIEGVEATVIIRQECVENCTVSLRSIDNIDVSHIAASYNGGGHKNASGLAMKGNITFVKQKMLESFSSVFI